MGIPSSGEIPAWSLGDRLRKARDHARLTQSELAAQIGIARESVTNYERSRTTPNRPVVVLWAIVTGVSLDWLTGSPHPGMSNVTHDDGGTKLPKCTPSKAPLPVAA